MNKAKTLQSIADKYNKENTDEYKIYSEIISACEKAALEGKKELTYLVKSRNIGFQLRNKVLILLEQDGFIVNFVPTKGLLPKIKVEWNDQENQITLIKITQPNYLPSPEDLEYLKTCYETGKMSDAVLKFGSVSIEKQFINSDYVTLVKVGGDDYKPSARDLDVWRQIFEEAKNDKDFKIFTHYAVNIEQIKLGKDTKIIVGDSIVLNYDTKVVGSTEKL